MRDLCILGGMAVHATAAIASASGVVVAAHAYGATGAAAISTFDAVAQVATTPAFVPTPTELRDKSERELPRQDADLGLARPAVGAARRELGKPEDEVSLDVSSYTVPPEAPQALREALPGLTGRFVGRQRTYEDMVNAASEVTRFLQRDLGYYLGYAYIPEQVPIDGQVQIGVLEGRLDHIVLNWSDDLPVRREVVQAYLDHLQPGDILTVQAVERTVFLINDLRGMSVKAEVKEGSLPGTAILEFTPRADPRLSGKADADINGSRFIGRERVGALLSLDSPLGRGDGLALTGLASASGGMKFVLLGYNSPAGGDGLKLGTSVSALRYSLDQELFPLGLDGNGVTVNAFGLYPWIRSRNLNLFALMSVDDKRYSDSVASVPTKKRVDDFNIGLTGDFRDSFATGGVNTFQVNLSSGRLHYDGGIPSGVDDAARYTKLEVNYTRLQNIVDGRWLAYFSTHGQLAFNNLDTTEQFRAGGPDGVRAFAPGEGTGDSGMTVTAELRWLPPESLFGRFSREIVLAGFLDAAQVVHRHDPSLLVRSSSYVNRSGFAGAGLSLVWARPGAYSMRMSLAKALHGTATGDTQERNPRLYLQGSWFF